MAKKIKIGSLELTKLKNVFIKNFKAKDGSLVECICIPTEVNFINEFPVKDADGVIQPDQSSNRFGIEIKIVEHESKDTFGNNGFISTKLPKEVYEANKQDENFLKNSTVIFGNFLNIEQPNPNAAGPEVPVVDPDDDGMPF